jgi:endonuclease/exonuclease/phosphatase (EEP) superfamily protein YafD
MKKKKRSVKKSSLLMKLRLVSLVVPPVGLVLVSLIGFLGDKWWLFDIFANFRFQYTWIAAVFLGFFLFLRVWRTGAEKIALGGSLVALILNGALVGSLYFPFHTPSGEPELKILFSNIFIYNNQSAALLRFIDTTNPDVVALAEVNDRMFGYYTMQLKDTYPYSFHKRQKRLFGVAVFSKTKPTNEDIVQYFSEDALPSLKLDLSFNNKPMRLIVTHPYPPMGEWKTEQRNGQLLGAAESIGKSAMPTVIVGDFNMTPWSPVFNQILEKGNLHNSMSGMGLQTSWPAWGPKPIRIPIDQALHTDDIEVTNRYRGPITGSDHRPIVVELRLK